MKKLPKCHVHNEEPGFFVNVRFRITRELIIDWMLWRIVHQGKGIPRTRTAILKGMKGAFHNQKFCTFTDSFVNEEKLSEENIADLKYGRVTAVRVVDRLFPELMKKNYQRQYGNWHYRPGGKS